MSAAQQVLPGMEAWIPEPQAQQVTPVVNRTMIRLVDMIRWHLHRGMRFFWKQITLAGKLGVSLSTVRRAIAVLVAGGKLVVHRRGPTSALYELVEDAPEQQVADAPERSSDRSSRRLSITDSQDVSRREGTVFEYPAVVFLRPERPGAPPRKTLLEKMKEFWTERGIDF